MKCPETLQLIEVALEEGVDEDLLVHVGSCPSCQSELRLIKEIPRLFHPDLDVPEALVLRVMSHPPFVDLNHDATTSWIQVLASGVLGSLTAAAAIVATGSMNDAAPSFLLGFCAAAGAVTGAWAGGRFGSPSRSGAA